MIVHRERPFDLDLYCLLNVKRATLLFQSIAIRYFKNFLITLPILAGIAILLFCIKRYKLYLICISCNYLRWRKKKVSIDIDSFIYYKDSKYSQNGKSAESEVINTEEVANENYEDLMRRETEINKSVTGNRFRHGVDSVLSTIIVRQRQIANRLSRLGLKREAEQIRDNSNAIIENKRV